MFDPSVGAQSVVATVVLSTRVRAEIDDHTSILFFDKIFDKMNDLI